MYAIRKRRRPIIYCSFCGKSEDEVFKIMSGPMVFICDECVVAAQQIVTDEKIKMGCTAVIGKMLASKAGD